MSEISPNLALPLLAASQAQKHVTHNDALLALDALVHLSVASRGFVEPPAAPTEGERYLVAGEGDGPWSGRGGAIACWRSGIWHFHVPEDGWLAWISDEERFLLNAAGSWGDPPAAFGRLGINAAADEANRLVVGGEASLFDGGTGSHRLKINKGLSAEAATLVFQMGHSGRAELGLAGSDDFALKVSSTGVGWTSVLNVNAATGKVGLGRPAGVGQLDVEGGIRSLSGAAAFLQLINTGPSGAQAWIGIPDWNRSAFYIYGGAADITTMYDTPTRSHRLFAGGSERIRIASGGDVGVGTLTPTARLHVAGPVRTGSYLKAALPSAATVGAGTLAYVQDAAGGAQFAYSDGTQWLKMRDGNPV